MSNFFGTALTGKTSFGEVQYDGPVYEGYHVLHGGEHSIAIESAQDQVGIIAAIAELDIHTTSFVAESAQANGEEGLQYVVESYEPVFEASGVGVIEKVKNAIKTLWGKVKAFFASVLRTLDGMTKSTADFVKKYKKQIEKINTAGMKYDMHTYTIDNLELSYSSKLYHDQEGVVNKVFGDLGNSGKEEELDAAIQKIRDGREEELEAFRASVIGGSGKMDATEFREAVRKKLRGDKDETEEVSVNIHKIIQEVEGTAKLKTKIDKVQKEADKQFAASIKLVDKLAGVINKASATANDKAVVKYNNTDGSEASKSTSTVRVARAATIANIISSTLSAQQAIVNAAISEWTAAVKERDSVYKKIIMKAFSHKPSDK